MSGQESSDVPARIEFVGAGDAFLRPGGLFADRLGTTRAVERLIEYELLMSSDPEFTEVVNLHYRSLFQFALSLTRAEADAADLTQQTFYVWATKRHQMRDRTKAKTWLFTTLHREYLSSRRRVARFPHLDLEEAQPELPVVDAVTSSALDAAKVLEALARVDEAFRVPLALFYLEDTPYKDISEILGVPIGTVKSRLSRGVAQLQQVFAPAVPEAGGKGRAHE